MIRGTARFGKLDSVPGLFHVATYYHHVNFFPLLPLNTVLVVEPGVLNPGETEIPLPADQRTMTVVYGRVVLLLLPLAACGVASAVVSEMTRERPLPMLPILSSGLVAAAVSGILFWMTLRATRALPARAHELADLAGISRDLVDAKLSETVVL